ncbi:CRISPR-associated protein, Crm2 family [Desulfofarcimen acetoxidans DSM 771]|uniref:CRISPR-associated protein, Crm2 family n=1 Tax=Desulfofarcimen acetoxidans (strain ATCC 49208 / DSM 771 / KCTC 5769 / VKM B-1644 / 5575) TaxID=485916 RepID=C8W3E7_DESAS|nr:type III-B CRISPR-associated protein Cas10/Cmr2 [Desulfofarcimen acetoxidans]ACV63733.1 CRISPR-associated protein, Crm2 family [Desulfofarcimen acetoxidans DSM 771]
MSKKILHFTLGPVQSFVAQARRTRDLWAGSFILSYLAGQAMYLVHRAGGKIIFPAVYDNNGIINDPLLNVIADKNEGKPISKKPVAGTLPNRFKAEIPGEFKPVECRQAVISAWREIAGAVWNKYIEPVAIYGKGTKEIWERQVNNFWEVSWVVSDNAESDDLLDRRKNWRSYVQAEEPGDKCTIMGNLQELSGHTRSLNSKKQDEFWGELRKKVKALELRKDERLCAVTIIKRLFPFTAKTVLGWDVPTSYPSNSNISAVHWVEKVMQNDTEKVVNFLEYSRNCGLAPEGGKQSAQIYCLRQMQKEKPEIAAFAKLNGNLFFESTLQNDNLWDESIKEQRKHLTKLLKEFKQSPEPFYAVLIMDGDSLGNLLRINDSAEVSQALSRFNDMVPKILEQNNGVLVYAGGDDVLALLPLEDAIKTAVEISRAYSNSFSGRLANGEATISAGIVYAHNHAPLKSILQEAHRLLDEIAKEETGRSSLAVSVWKTAGRVLQWSAPWEVITSGDSCLVDELVEDFRGKSSYEDQYNSSFFYNLRKRFDWLSGDNNILTFEEAVDLLAAEYLKNRGRENIAEATAKSRVEKLLMFCRRFLRGPDGVQSLNKLNVDGALLVRFLAEKGVVE